MPDDKKSGLEDKAIKEGSGFLEGFWDTIGKLIDLAAAKGDLKKKMDELDELIAKETGKIKDLGEEIDDLEDQIDRLLSNPAPAAGREKRKFERHLSKLKEELGEKQADKKAAQETKKALQDAKKQAAKGGAK